jgi:hypothetical protein
MACSEHAVDLLPQLGHKPALPLASAPPTIVHTVTQNEYEHSKQRLEEQRRAGVELVERAHEAQMRALELVWMLQGGAGSTALPAGAVAAAPPPPASPPAAQPQPKKGPEVEDDVYSQFWKLPEVFTRRDVCRVLGYEPDRAVLHRILKKLLGDGFTSLEFKGDGQRPAKYRKTGKERSPDAE